MLMWLSLAVVLLLLTACGGKPFEPEAIGEVKSGPELFSGKKGGLVVLE